MSGDPSRRSLDHEVLAWMRSPAAADDEARFDALALALFAHQFEHCAPYRRFCEGRGASPESVHDPAMIPAVPTGAFKELVLTAFPPETTCHVFRTSGTSTARRGALHLDTLTLYEASLLPTFERFVLCGLPRRNPILILAPSTEEQPDSSLSHMFETVRRKRGDPTSAFFLREGALDLPALTTALHTAERGSRPLVVCGTSPAFVHLIEALRADGTRLALPAGSRVMETGGFKGHGRHWERDELHDAIASCLGVAPDHIVNQYGMTELGSQFYDSVLAHPGEPRRKLGPPWARVLLRHPETGALLPSAGRDGAPGRGAPGVVHVLDLANTGSVIAIQTADLAVRIRDGFDVLGRAPGAEERGCSIAADAMLLRGAP